MKNKKVLTIVAAVAAVVIIAAVIILCINLNDKNDLKDYIDTETSYLHETIYNQDGVTFDIYTFDSDITSDVDESSKTITVTDRNIDKVMKMFDDHRDDIYHIEDMLTQFDFRFDPKVTVSVGDKYMFEKDDNGNYTIFYYDPSFETAFVFEYNY